MEMLVVIVIIVALAALAFVGLGHAKRTQNDEKARVQVELLRLALEDYRSDKGSYPENARSSGTDGTTAIYDALYPQGGGQKVYLPELNPENDPQGWLDGATGPGPHRIVDPWGNEFRYRTNESGSDEIIAANPGFDLWSMGPDGETSAGAGGSYDPNDPVNRDDIPGW